MIPYIVDTDMETRLAIVDDYTSFIWTERYYNTGDFEIVVPADERFIDLMKKDRYIVREDREEWGIIEKISIEQIERISDANSRMVVSGRFSSSIIGRRVVAYLTATTTAIPVGSWVRGLLNQHAIEPANPVRTIPDLTFTDLSGETATLQQQITGKNLLESIADICKKFGLGFRIDRENGKWAFKLYKGTDRSINQSTVPPIIFSVEYDNLDSIQYEADYTNIVSAVRIAGEGQGINRKIYWYETGAEGLDRYELWKDARNASTQTEDGTIPESEYRAQLLEEASEDITVVKEAIAGRVDFSNIVYREDVFLGDIVTVKCEAWGIEMNPRLIEVIESTDETGMHTFTPTFGE
jgi:uncharacterized protein YlzI (FlbEa/FlbD family)